jgi:hypothetical protein
MGARSSQRSIKCTIPLTATPTITGRLVLPELEFTSQLEAQNIPDLKKDGSTEREIKA